MCTLCASCRSTVELSGPCQVAETSTWLAANRLLCGARSPQKLFALARVFGNIPDDLFSRSYEAMIFRTVARAGMGPKLLVGAASGAMSAADYDQAECLAGAWHVCRL